MGKTVRCCDCAQEARTETKTACGARVTRYYCAASNRAIIPFGIHAEEIPAWCPRIDETGQI